MTDHFKEHGRHLLANGYLIVPIKKGEKRPAISSWQKARLGSGDLDRYPGHGVGVLCGQGANPVVGVDIDISHPQIGAALLQWCRMHLGETAERVGAAPRILLVYRAKAAGWAKGMSVRFFDPSDPLKIDGRSRNDQQVEILGLGQQFVAYHQHPDTGRDYEWMDLFGGIDAVRADELPLVTEDQLDRLLAEVARLVRMTPGLEVRESGMSPAHAAGGSADDDLMALTEKVGRPIEEVAALMAHLKNDEDDYDTWAHVGMALHHEFAGTEHEDEAKALWREYGAKSSKNQTNQYDFKWRSFGGYSRSPTTLRWLLKICHIAKHEAEGQAKLDALTEIKALLAQQDDLVKLGSKKLLDKVQELLPEDPLFRAEVVSAYQAQHKAVTGHSLPVTQARTLIFGARVPTVRAKRPLTEFGNAERMLDRYSEGLMYVPEMQSWFIWTGVYWRKAPDIEIEHYAKETIKALVSEVDEHEERAEFFQFCAISQQAKMVRNVVSLAASDPKVAVPARELDRQWHLLGTQNGVVNLLTGELLAPHPSYRTTLTAGCDYEPGAKCPLFLQTVREVFNGNEAMVEYFLTALGYALLGNPTEDLMFIPFGNGSNGKSTVLGVVRQMFGSYARSAEASSFVSDGKSTAGGAREDLVRLRGARFVYVNEPDENGELREGAVKAMTGGDVITARGLYAKESVEIVPTWTVFMPTNHKPIVKGSDNGIWRRLVLIPFERNFDHDPKVVKDPKREEKLLQELPGVLSLIVRYALRFQASGLKQPDVVKAARDSYRNQMDLLAEWLEECCETGEGKTCESNHLWLSWEKFAKERGILNYVRSSVALGRRLDARFSTFKGSRGVRMRLGIALKDDFGVESEAGTAGDDLF